MYYVLALHRYILDPIQLFIQLVSVEFFDILANSLLTYTDM